MELSNGKPCIISVGVGSGYAAGIDRLSDNLRFHGWLGDTIFWKDYPEGCPPHERGGQYNFKLYAFKEAFKRGYKSVLWLDSSFYPLKDPMPVFDYINDNGLFFFKSGYPMSATATDNLLECFGVNREELIDVSEFATGAVGIRIDNPNGKDFFRRWHDLMVNGFFNGSRNHDNKDSQHPLFRFSRQDQSAASMALWKMGIKTAGEDKDWVSYYPTVTDRTIFFIKGI